MFDFLRRITGSHSVGAAGERLARRHLRKQRYRILGRNLRSRLGEIDIIAEAPDRTTVVIVEVKTSAHHSGELAPEVHVDQRKQRKLVQLACQLARRHHLTDRPLRFDVIGVELPARGRAAVIRHHIAAFEAHV